MALAAQSLHPSRSLGAYAPRLAGEWLSRTPDQRHRAVDGSLAFVDISGFTKLTERLTRAGRVGSEELSDILDRTFAGLLTAARGDGADLLKWGGDAVLLLFRDEDHAARAARAAYRMRRTLREIGSAHASAGNVTLRMSVGIHSGRFDFFLVGDPSIHRELIVCGEAASTTAEMEAIASAGQIVVSEATAAHLHPASVGQPIGDGRILRSAPLLPDLPASEADESVDVSGLLPPPVREHLLAAAGSSEHRPVGVAFIQFSGTDELIRTAGAEAAAQALDECLRNVQQACASNGVTFLESDINRDGGKFMLVAGAPRSTGNADDRLLRAVQLAVSRAGRLPMRAGVNHGRVFTGDFGPSFRRTYSVKGDANNVAARVMGKAAPGEVLATAEVMARARTRFRTRHVEPFLVKGKAKPIEAVLLGPPVGEEGEGVGGGGGGVAGAAADQDEPFFGRESELAALDAAAERARAGTGVLVEVIGEPGMGKSRLIGELRRRTSDLHVLFGPSGAYESSIAYYPFRALCRELLGMRAEDDVETLGRRLSERVAADAPHLAPWLPLLGVVLDVAVAATRETSELDAAFRKAKLAEVLLDFLDHTLRAPTLLVFENVHLSDDASAELLHQLQEAAAQRPWLVLVTRRELATGFVPSGPARVSLPLSPIAGEQALALLVSTTSDTPLSAHAMAAIMAKAGGNPLFLRALVTAAARTGGVDELPDSVEEVLTSELDRLEPDDRTLLRYAAVLGVTFSESMLREMLVAGGSTAVDTDLARLGEFVQAEGPAEWHFRHALIRDVAYAGLPFRLRRQLHAHAGQVLAATAPSLDEVSERLSLHFFHAGDHVNSWAYSRMAGRRAQRQFAYLAAIEFFERALESGRASEAASRELAEVLEDLGDVREIAGLTPDAVLAYRRARPYRRDDPVGRAALLLKEAGLHQRLGAFGTSMRILAHARGVLRDLGGPEAGAIRSRLATRVAFAKYVQGDTAAAMRWSAVGVREAQVSGDRDALAYAFNTRHLACLRAGVAEEEPYGELALAMYEQTGDLRMQAHCLNNLAISAVKDGRWTQSAELFERAAQAFERVGDTANEANVRYNTADLLIRQHRFAQAEPLLVAARRAARAADDRELVALVARETGRVLTGLGRHDEALEQFTLARDVFAELGLALETVLLDAAVAERLIEVGDPDAAIAVAGDAIARAVDAGAESELAALHRVHGAALLAAQRYAEARAAFEAGLRSPEGDDGRRAHALNQLGLAELAQREHRAASGDTDSGSLRQVAMSTLDALGVLIPEAAGSY